MVTFISEKFSIRQTITWGLFILCAYAAWARGGTYPPLQWPLLLISFILCFSPLLIERDRRRPFYRRVGKDPFFWAGSGLMLIVILQWMNSGYWVVLNESGEAEMLRKPPVWFPWSVDRAEAGEMFIWFFPVWIGVLLIRNLLHRKHLIALFYLLAINSAVLSCFGLFLNAIGSENVLGIWEQRYTTFFASFSYANHAAEWFYINAFLAIGLAHESFSRKRPAVQTVVWTIVFYLNVIAVLMTLSRFGAVVALSLLAVCAGIFLRHALMRLRGVPSLNIYLFAGVFILIGMVLFFGAGEGRLAEEIGQKSMVGDVSVLSDLKGRIDQMPLAWRIVQDYPLFGAGGWSYRWMGKMYLPSHEWSAFNVMGKANVHCDPLQFLSEFGFAGAVLLISCLGILLRGAIACFHKGKAAAWIVSGAFVVFIHSLIDLPFRCPAVLLQLTFILAALPRFSGINASQDLVTGMQAAHANR